MKAGKLIFSDTCALHNIVIGGGIFPRIHRDQQRSKDKCHAGKTQLRRKTSRGSRRCSSWKQHEGTQRNHHEIVGQIVFKISISVTTVGESSRVMKWYVISAVLCSFVTFSHAEESKTHSLLKMPSRFTSVDISGSRYPDN
nr:uncharacterized protein LOC131771351 isoform X3 [Pocillopora verrucosa]